jgi:hypothetical protein
MRVLGCKRPLPRRNRRFGGAMGLLRRGDLGILSCEEGFAGGEGRGGRKEVVLCAGFALTDMAFFSWMGYCLVQRLAALNGVLSLSLVARSTLRRASSFVSSWARRTGACMRIGGANYFRGIFWPNLVEYLDIFSTWIMIPTYALVLFDFDASWLATAGSMISSKRSRRDSWESSCMM